jgi:DNA-binding YbaB/EbfC family protein
MLDQAKMIMKLKQAQKELAKQVVDGEAGDGAVVVSVTGELKIKKVTIDPEYVDLDDIGVLERWIEQATKEAMSKAQEVAADKMKPLMGGLGNLGL